MISEFTCPNCQKAFKLRDELIGKRVTCAGCRKVFLVQAPSSTGPSPPPAPAPKVAAPKPTKKPDPKPKPTIAPVDADDLALSALSENEVVPETVKADAVTTVTFKCQHCDYENTVDGRMAGRNVPCGDCKRVVKVPVPVKADPKDWRTAANKIPSGARRDQDNLDGAWGSENRSYVSRDALVEAEAAHPSDTEPMSWTRRISLGVAGLLLLVVVVGGTRFAIRKRSQGQDRDLIEMALKAVDRKSDEKLPRDRAAIVQWYAGTLYLSQGRLKDAKIRLDEARNGLVTGTSLDRLAALVEVAATYSELGGDAQEVEQGKRLDWQKDQLDKGMRIAFQAFSGDRTEDGRDLRTQAVRACVRSLAARGQSSRIDAIIRASCTPDEWAEMTAAAGLELLSLGQREAAEEFAKRAELNLANGGRESAFSLVALWLALGAPDAPPEKAARYLSLAKNLSPEPGSGEVPLVSRVGYAEGLARQGKVDQARALAWRAGQADHRLRAGAAVASAVIDVQPGEVKDLDACAAIVVTELKGRPVPVWVLIRLAQLSHKANKPELAAKFAAGISDPGLRSWARLEGFRSRLRAKPEKTELDEIDPKSLAHAVARAEFARALARSGETSAARSEVDGWQPESLRAFGLAGIALAGNEPPR